jgi:hypothetical protein
MKELIKNFYQSYKCFFKGVLTLLGVIAIFDWFIFPGLTAPITIINILSFSLLIIVLVVVQVIIWNSCSIFEPKPIELTEEEKEKIITSIKEKGLYQEPTKIKSKTTK